ncbi:tumor necrosis factor receptor superfamily member 9a [Archocentrus centrarchus]|uniref:tumor necrosis factor receptor superfamily member 9a n=1 Tax=Archocentrus centrarchus TaxID=63155 RepID=UPI0011E9FBE4|nr:tumor necrosis factor receptor superfamily member 9-like [Archocentrus centrarchus]
MDLIAWLVVLFLSIQCSVGQVNTGCLKWTQRGSNVCCDICHPGNRLVKDCGPDPSKLCKPCELGTYTVKPKEYSCVTCAQCVGAQVLIKNCTATTDTKCGCKEGLTCGNAQCSFCVEECAKGFEPTADRSCRKCPNGTFNDKVHQKCKPWSVKCSNPNEVIEAKGDAFNDIKCFPVSVHPVISTKAPDHANPIWPVLLGLVGLAFVTTITILIMMILVKKLQKGKKKKTSTKPPPIRPPTDDPRTLIAIECSFHEAQQEQGSTCSIESLDSKDSSEQLIA